MDTSYFDDFSNPDEMVGYKELKLRQAQVQEAEAAADAKAQLEREKAEKAAKEKKKESKQDDLYDMIENDNQGALPHILRVQDPWKGAFVGFTFRYQEPR
jgi:hypothetical protein